MIEDVFLLNLNNHLSFRPTYTHDGVATFASAASRPEAEAEVGRDKGVQFWPIPNKRQDIEASGSALRPQACLES